MSWDELAGQQPAKDYLRAVLRGERLAHAYLFKGPAGVGKRTAAYIFAQAALCHQPPAPDQPCGKCQSCLWLAARRGALSGHPDMISLLKTGKNGGEADSIVGDHEQVIRLETVQYVCEQLHRTPMAGARRVAIIPEAQRLCRGQAEAANAFLKTLEEPPAAALLILTSHQPEALLETITSRVQAVQFRRLAAQEIRAQLQAKLRPRTPETGAAGEVAPPAETDIELAVALSGGSLGEALELLTGDLRGWRAAVLTGLNGFNRQSWLNFGISLWSLADAEGKRLFALEKDARKGEEVQEEVEREEESEGALKTEAGWKRFVMRRLLEVCEICFRDALICAVAGEGSPLLLQPDQRKLAEGLAGKFGARGCEKAVFFIRDAVQAVNLYVRGDVVGRALAGRLFDALK